MPAMSGFERQAFNVVRGGQAVDYWSIPIYKGVDPIPVGVTIRAEGEGAFYLYVSVLNR